MAVTASGNAVSPAAGSRGAALVQEIFREVTRGEIEKVRARLEAKPALIAVTATGAPKKYVNQSLLQIALRTAQFEIADMLVAMGADVNFYDEANADGWAAPVINDAAAAAVIRARWSATQSKTRSDAAFATLLSILEAGADINALDSRGGTVLGRAVFEVDDRTHGSDANMVPETVADVTRVFAELFARGADLNVIMPNRGRTILEAYRSRPVARYLVPAVQNS